MGEITRRCAMQKVQRGEEVLCQLAKNNVKKISTVQDLTEVVLCEQRRLTDGALKFFEEN